MTTRTRIIPGKGVVTERIYTSPDPILEVDLVQTKYPYSGKSQRSMETNIGID